LSVNPNFETLAAAFNVGYARVDGPESLPAVLKRACSEGGPTLIEAPVEAMPNPWSLIRLSEPPAGFSAPPNPLGDPSAPGADLAATR
jgi:acetolactate synthase-1/2/3 large subunit